MFVLGAGFESMAPDRKCALSPAHWPADAWFAA